MGFLRKTDELFRVLGDAGDAKGGPSGGLGAPGPASAPARPGARPASAATLVAIAAASSGPPSGSPSSAPASASASVSAAGPATHPQPHGPPAVLRPAAPAVRVAPLPAHPPGMFGALLPPGATAGARPRSPAAPVAVAPPPPPAPGAAPAAAPEAAPVAAPAGALGATPVATLGAAPTAAGAPSVASGAAPAAARGATHAAALTPARVAEPAAPLDSLLDDDAPILVVEDFPPNGTSALFGSDASEPAKPFLARTLTLRYDTATVGAFLGAIAISVAFLLGRASVDVAAAPAEVARGEATAITAPLAPSAAPALAGVAPPPPPAVLAPAARDAEDAAPNGAPAIERPEAPPRAASLASASASSPSALAPSLPAGALAPPEARWWIPIVQRGRKEGCEELKKHLEANGFPVILEEGGSGVSVFVGPYADRTSAEAERDLARLRKLAAFKGVNFQSAQFHAMRRGATR